MSAGAKILEGLKDAVAGNFASVYINGQTWARVDWQPIEMAPKDGSSVLLFTTSEGDADLTEYLKAGGDIELPFERVQIGWWSGAEWELQVVGNPTHWMPLPKPPGGAA